VNISKCAFTVVAAGSGGPPAAASDAAAAAAAAAGASESEGDEAAVGDEAGEGSEDGEGSDEEEEEELDAFRTAGVSGVALDALTAAVEGDPSALLQPSAEVADLARAASRALFQYAAKLAEGGAAAAPPPPPPPQQPPAQSELYVEGFDPEQIWLQLDMAAVPALKLARRQLRKAGDVASLLPADVEAALDGAPRCLWRPAPCLCLLASRWFAFWRECSALHLTYDDRRCCSCCRAAGGRGAGGRQRRRGGERQRRGGRQRGRGRRRRPQRPRLRCHARGRRGRRP
jgi:hypothetical protein